MKTGLQRPLRAPIAKAGIMARMGIFFRRKAGRAVAGALAICALAGCGAARDDAPGRDAPTFVSLNPCLDAILVEVAEPEQILALSHYSRDPSASSMDVERAHQFGVTGGTVEEILPLEPDVVLASTFIAPATRNALDRLGLRVESFGSPANSAESIEQVRALATLTENTSAGEALVARIEALPAAKGDGDLTALLWQPGQIVPGQNTLVAEHIRAAGFADYAAERGLAQADYISLEQILSDPPDLLLVAGNSAGQRHPILSGALPSMRVAEYDPSLLYCGGPTIPAARERLKALHDDMGRGPQ